MHDLVFSNLAILWISIQMLTLSFVVKVVIFISLITDADNVSDIEMLLVYNKVLKQ